MNSKKLEIINNFAYNLGTLTAIIDQILSDKEIVDHFQKLGVELEDFIKFQHYAKNIASGFYKEIA